MESPLLNYIVCGAMPIAPLDTLFFGVFFYVNFIYLRLNADKRDLIAVGDYEPDFAVYEYVPLEATVRTPWVASADAVPFVDVELSVPSVTVKYQSPD